MYAEHQPERISLYRKSGALLLAQHAAADSRPFIHPIIAPDGKGVLTENEPEHHPWQHGLYVGLNKVNGVGFWTEGKAGLPAEGTFHPQPLAPPTVDPDRKRARWQVVTDWRSHEGQSLIRETQQWTFCDGWNHYLLDLKWTLQAMVDLTFGQYPYGGLFLRMPFRKQSGGSVLNSEGLAGLQAEARRARWVAVSMPIAGREDEAGMAIMDHPQNPEHPVPWRVDDQLGIGPSRCIAGEWRLPAGETAIFRHRVFVFTGKMDPEEIERQWQLFKEENNE